MLCGEQHQAQATAEESSTPADDQARAAAERRLATDPNIGQALTRLDDLAGWEPGTARTEVAARLTQLDRRHLLDRADRRSRIGQPAIAAALAAYYHAPPMAPAGTASGTRRHERDEPAHSSGLA